MKEYQQSKDGPTLTRFQAVRMYGSGYVVSKIAALTRFSRISLMEWCQAFDEQEVIGLRDKRQGGIRAKLTDEPAILNMTILLGEKPITKLILAQLSPCFTTV